MIASVHQFKEPVSAYAELIYSHTRELVYIFKRFTTDKGYTFFFGALSNGSKVRCFLKDGKWYAEDKYNKKNMLDGQIKFDMEGVGL